MNPVGRIIRKLFRVTLPYRTGIGEGPGVAAVIGGLLVFISVAANSSAQGTSTPPFSQAFLLSASFGQTVRFAVADIVGNSFPDLVTVRTSMSSVVIEESLTGGITHVSQPPIAVAAGPTDVAIGDLDGDSDLDIVTVSTSQISVLLRSGTAYSRTDFGLVNANAQRLSLGDIDGDGDLDCLRGSVAALNAGNGTFGVTSILATINGAPFAADFGDFDGDGDLDMARSIASVAGASITAWTNNGGLFSLSTTTPLGSIWLLSSAIADMNADGRDDIVLHHTTGNFDTRVTVCLGQPNGSFVVRAGGAASYFIATMADTPAIADFDGDGDPDVVAASVGFFTDFTFPVSRIWLNNGSGDLHLVASSGGYQTQDIEAFDFDLDGDVDFVASFYGELRGFSNLAALTGLGGPPTLTVISGNGQVADMFTPFAQPLVVRVTGPTGAPMPGVAVEFVPIGNPTPPGGMNIFWATTDSGGFATSYTVAGNAAGAVTVEARVSSAAIGVFNLTVVPLSVSIISGSNQATSVNSMFPQPLIVEVRGSNGTLLPNVPVTFVAGPTVYLSSTGTLSGTVLTNAAGRATAFVFAGYSPTALSTTVTAGVGNVPVGAPVVFGLTILGVAQIVPIGPATIALDPGESSGTIVCEVRNAMGLAQPNVSVVVVSTPSGSFAIYPAGPFVTDAQGRIAFTATPSPASSGALSITVFAPSLSAFMTIPVFVRRLTCSLNAGQNLINVLYRHEDGPQALILAVDLPMGAPSSSPFGAIATSILAPGPSLFVADTFGAFGVSDPGLVANPNFARNYTISPGLAGSTAVVQIYGFDPDYMPNLAEAIFVSNAVIVSL